MENEQETITTSDDSSSGEQTDQRVEAEANQSNQETKNNQEEGHVQDRPEWLYSKFETPEQMQTSYHELQKKFHTRRDEIKQELIQELNTQAEKDIPISPADYKLEVKTAEGMDVQLNENDPMLNWFRDKAHNYGLKQNEFSDLLGEYNTMMANSGPDWNQESQTLGEHADRRLERIDTWASSHLSKDAYATFAKIPASADMVKTFEEVMELNGQPQFNMVSPTEFQEVVTQDDLKSAMAARFSVAMSTLGAPGAR